MGTLEGSVPYYYQVEDAAGAVRRLAGVRGVTNNICVDADTAVPVAAREAVRAALQRQAGREADRINVEVEGGELTLFGTVRSWAEKRAVVGAAGHVPGILAVNDRINRIHLRVSEAPNFLVATNLSIGVNSVNAPKHKCGSYL